MPWSSNRVHTLSLVGVVFQNLGIYFLFWSIFYFDFCIWSINAKYTDTKNYKKCLIILKYLNEPMLDNQRVGFFLVKGFHASIPFKLHSALEKWPLIESCWVFPLHQAERYCIISSAPREPVWGRDLAHNLEFNLICLQDFILHTGLILEDLFLL